jgi:predicted cupin superfamily sugar epimerase
MGLVVRPAHAPRSGLFEAPSPAGVPSAMRADQLIRDLELSPHPEGGWYRRVHRSSLHVQCDGVPRAALTTILYLLRAGETSRWHRIDAEEAWHHYEGAPLRLWRASMDFHEVEELALGRASATSSPCHVVPAGAWQAARSLGDYTLVGCTVAPGFEFGGFSLLAGDPISVTLLHTYAPHCADLV